MLMGLLFPNLIKKWLFESLQRSCNILYLLHHHSSIFIDTSIIFETLNRALLVCRNSSPCKGSIMKEVKCVPLRTLCSCPHSTRIRVSSPGVSSHCLLVPRACWNSLCVLLSFLSSQNISLRCCSRCSNLICMYIWMVYKSFLCSPPRQHAYILGISAAASRALIQRRNLTFSRWYFLILIEPPATCKKSNFSPHPFPWNMENQ